MGIPPVPNCLLPEDCQYIIRKLKDTKQAYTEFLISKELPDITPRILLSRHNLPYIKHELHIYNLQIYIENGKEYHGDTNFFALGKTLAQFHSKTKNIHGIFENRDRFDLEKMLLDLQEGEFNQFERKNELVAWVEQCLNYEHSINCYIHGDLGKWNLLFNQSKIYIIDFGEVRKGNNHFDLSAAISSNLNWSRGENEIISSLTEFRNGYISHFESFDWNVLKENFMLWFTRGIVSVFTRHGLHERTTNYAKITMERMENIERILNDNFIQGNPLYM